MQWKHALRSLMLKLPYLQEIYAYSNVAEFDMCVVGDLRGPHKPETDEEILYGRDHIKETS